jgi:hypothetical protein
MRDRDNDVSKQVNASKAGINNSHVDTVRYPVSRKLGARLPLLPPLTARITGYRIPDI